MCLWAVGYGTVHAVAHRAEAGAYFFSRLHQQTNLDDTVAGRLTPLELASFLHPVQGTLLENDLFMGAKEQGEARLIASRVPETRVHARRRKARKNAKKKGDTPSQAHLTRLAWPLFLTKVSRTIWKTETVVKGYPVRWQRAMIFQSWKSSLP